MTEQTKKAEEQKADAKAKAKPVRKQKYTEADLKRMGLDPAPYGFAAKK